MRNIYLLTACVATILLHFASIVTKGNSLSTGFANDSIVGVEKRIILDIGSRLELFLDDYLIEYLGGKAELRLHHPESEEMVIVNDRPWEESIGVYASIFKDGNKYRMFYMSSSQGRNYVCYAESNDGIIWSKPELGLYDYQGSKANNIVIAPDDRIDGKIMAEKSNMKIPSKSTYHIAIFKDDNPNATKDTRYKGFVMSWGTSAVGKLPYGLVPLCSPDGIHWSLISDTTVISGSVHGGAFDSENLAFWDSVRSEYRAYWRSYTREIYAPWPASYQGFRSIRTARSKDFIEWFDQEDLIYVDSTKNEHLYTNQIKPYYRAPHIFIGFPTRYIDRGWSESMVALPELEHREKRANPARNNRRGTALTEALIMVSRDGVLFKRWDEAFLRPGIERSGTWNYGHQYIGWSFVETKSLLEGGAPNELSFYATEGRLNTGEVHGFRRYTLRTDGFVSVNAPMTGGELITKPISFTGSNLILNFSTSAAGSIKVEIQDEHGNPFTGFALENCSPIFGDTIERAITWNFDGNIVNLSSLKGKIIRLRFVLKDADLFSLRFK